MYFNDDKCPFFNSTVYDKITQPVVAGLNFSQPSSLKLPNLTQLATLSMLRKDRQLRKWSLTLF